MNTEIVRSVYPDQEDILRGIQQLYCPDGFECDIAYGNGRFWKNIPEPQHKFDIDPQMPEVRQSCSTAIPVAAAIFNNIVFDPPFLTYVRAGRTRQRHQLGFY